MPTLPDLAAETTRTARRRQHSGVLSLKERS